MKFLSEHRVPIIKTLERANLSVQDIEFIKKKGRINILHSPSGYAFSYLRIKETQIHPVSHQWVHSESFKISINGQKEEIKSDWNEVMAEFNSWVSKIR